jgi:3-phenylpropionate/trans-cinnamate dioxygenase ferredoxin reductase subunit
MEPIVVIGAGQAGASAVTELRKQGYAGPLVVVGEEPHLPYQRPPLSKGYLLGQDPIDTAYIHPQDWYAAHDVTLLLDETAIGIDRAAGRVHTTHGSLRYAGLLLATGSRPRRLALADGSGVPTAYLRTIEDSDRIKDALGPERRVVVIGAGWIGLEVAAAARQAGSQVTVFEMAELPLLRVLGPRVATVFADLHRNHGVDLRLDTAVTRDDLAGADLVVVGVGVEPVVDLAADAGLAVDNGVLVDAALRTEDPRIVAAGDIAHHDHPVLGRIRVEHWDTAVGQGEHAARTLLGDGAPYERLPFFFTDQYDLGMEYVGHGSADDEVVIEGDVDGLTFRAYWLRDGLVTAGMHVNDWDAIDEIRATVGTRRS